MSRASVIVSNEPPDPKIDPKVQDILMEVVTEGQTTTEHTNKYEINLNVINDNGDDNDTY